MTAISSLQSLTLDLPPSCIAFCPSHPEYFIVGTYFLHPRSEADNPVVEDEDGNAAQRRTGSLVLFRLEGESLTQVNTLETSAAILDIQWTRHPEIHGNLLAVATSTGCIELYTLVPAVVNAGQSSEGVRLVEQTTIRVADPSILVLSIAWHPSFDRVLGFTLSNGAVGICELLEGEKWNALRTTPGVETRVNVREVHRHELEAWTLAFLYSHEPGPDSELEDSTAVKVLSGGDDAVFACSTTSISTANATSSSADDDDDATPSTLWIDRRIHQAGVTAILPLHAHDIYPNHENHRDNLILTGSYDDHIRLLSCPASGRRTVLAELNLGGGVWRLKLLDRLPSPSMPVANTARTRTRTCSVRILASCMHAGARIVRLSHSPPVHDGEGLSTGIATDSGNWTFEIEARFEEHASMNYGSDVQPRHSASRKSLGSEPKRGKGEQDQMYDTIVSTSFYDRLLCLWRCPRGNGAS